MALDRVPGDASLYIGGYVFVQISRGLARLSSLSLSFSLFLSFSRPSQTLDTHSHIFRFSLSPLLCVHGAKRGRRGNETLRLM